jgi:hypothetical protein
VSAPRATVFPASVFQDPQAETICSIISMPVEMLIRPQYGTRYFSVPVTFFSGALMLLLPALSLMWQG